jgi:hypothetical protein
VVVAVSVADLLVPPPAPQASSSGFRRLDEIEVAGYQSFKPNILNKIGTTFVMTDWYKTDRRGRECRLRMPGPRATRAGLLMNTPPALRLHVLIPLPNLSRHGPQLRATASENVIVTQTRARIPLGPPPPGLGQTGPHRRLIASPGRV